MDASIKMDVDADFEWRDLVIGADLDAIEFAHDNKYFLIKNRQPHHHSYEKVEEIWAQKIYQLFDLGLAPFSGTIDNIRIYPEAKLAKVFISHSAFLVRYKNLHIFDFENVSGVDDPRRLARYRVIDWFDCKGLHGLDTDQISTEEKFVSKIKFFKTLRIDGNQRYLDLFCESVLTKEQLKSFNYSDTMARLKILDLLKKRGFEPEMHLWKRDVYPIYETI